MANPDIHTRVRFSTRTRLCSFQCASGSQASIVYSGQGFPEGIRTALESVPFLLRHLRFNDPLYTSPPEHARHGESDAVLWIVRTDGNHSPFVTQYPFSNARRHHSNPELAGLITFDDGDIGVADFSLDTPAEMLVIQIPWFEKAKDRRPPRPRRRVREYFSRLL